MPGNAGKHTAVRHSRRFRVVLLQTTTSRSAQAALSMTKEQLILLCVLQADVEHVPFHDSETHGCCLQMLCDATE